MNFASFIGFTFASALAVSSCKSDGSGKRSLPGPSEATEHAPEQFRAKFATSKGDFTIEVHRDWAPNGADRFYNLVRIGFYDDARFFRVVPGFVVQWGIHADGDSVMSKWRNAQIADDPPKESNKPGTVTFAMAGPNTRTTQVFVNYGDNSRLDATGFAAFGKVVDGMNVVQALYSGYGQTPDQAEVQRAGNAYLKRDFPELDYIKKAEIAR